MAADELSVSDPDRLDIHSDKTLDLFGHMLRDSEMEKHVAESWRLPRSSFQWKIPDDQNAVFVGHEMITGARCRARLIPAYS